MAVQSNRKALWFGTEEHMDWFATPLRGADSSPEGWGVSGTLLNGGGYGYNSWGTHKNYTYEWPESSSPEVAQMMKSYRDGTYGRGLLYFIEPMTYGTNILPAHWADPSLAVGGESPSIVPGVEPTAVPTSGWQKNGLPVKSAYFSIVPYSPTVDIDRTVFVPIPEGYTLYLGAFYSGANSIFAVPVVANGGTLAPVALTQLANDSDVVVHDTFSGVKGVRLWVNGGMGGGITVTALIARLIKTTDVVRYGPWMPQATNLFTNPSFETGAGTVEVRRNWIRDPKFAGPNNWSTQTTGVITKSSVNGKPALLVSAGTGTNMLIGSTAPESTGKRFAARVTLVPTATTAGAEIRIFYFDGAASGTTSVILPTTPGEEVEAVLPASRVSEGTVRLYFAKPPDGAWAEGDEFYVVSPLVEEVSSEGALPGEYFDGDTSPDSDLTPSWVGAPNASESILTGVGVAGLTGGSGCIAIRSTQWKKTGDYSLRLIPTSTTNNLSYVTSNLPLGAQANGTVIVTGRQSASMTGPIWQYRGRPYVINPQHDSTSQLANTSGEMEHRIQYNLGESPSKLLLLPHGGLAGSGDVWYDCVGMFEGAYDGPWFDGNSETTTDVRRSRWTGTPNAPTSQLETRTRSGSPAKQAQITSGPWVGGQGHSGARFMGAPSYVTNSPIAGGRVGFAASFKEVGSWEFGL